MLSVNDLRKDNLEKKKKEYQIYKEVLKDVNVKIKEANSKGYNHVSYYVKPFMIDKPLYKFNGVMKYLKIKLTEGGFVGIDEQQKLYVYWNVEK